MGALYNVSHTSDLDKSYERLLERLRPGVRPSALSGFILANLSNVLQLCSFTRD